MNRTELFVKKLFEGLDIMYPSQLSLEYIAQSLNLSIIYWPFSSELTLYKGIYKVFINENINKYRQWQDFGHEMYHYFHDEVSYDLLKETYAVYGESKANYFSYHFCVPTFMLLNMKEISIEKVINLFKVEYDFAYRRLKMFESKIIDGGG